MKYLILIILFVSLIIPFQALAAEEEAPININTADVTTLAKLKRIGPVKAQRIVDSRKEHGRFENKEDLKKVKGIGPKILAINLEMITVD